MAFSLYDTQGEKLLNETRYIQWIPSYTQKIDGELFKERIGYHLCTAAELANFNPSTKLHKADLDVWIERGLFCFDQFPEGAAIGGLQDGQSYSQFTLTFAPCNFASAEDLAYVTEDCIPDLDQMKKYLGTPRIAWYFNFEAINMHEFGENTISRESRIETLQIDP